MAIGVAALVFLSSLFSPHQGCTDGPSVRAQQGRSSLDEETDSYMKRLYEEGQKVFRMTPLAPKRSGAISCSFIARFSANRREALGPGSVRALLSNSD